MTKIRVQLGTRKSPQIESTKLPTSTRALQDLAYIKTTLLDQAESHTSCLICSDILFTSAKTIKHQDAPHIRCISLLSWIALSFLLLPSHVPVCSCWSLNSSVRVMLFNLNSLPRTVDHTGNANSSILSAQ